MTSADFCTGFPSPLDVGSTSWHLCRSPRVWRTHLHAYACRIYAASFRASFGLCISLPAYPDTSPPIRFLFVRPALCLRLPSDSRSPATPLPSANSSPCRASRGLSPPSKCALPGAQRKRAKDFSPLQFTFLHLELRTEHCYFCPL